MNRIAKKIYEIVEESLRHDKVYMIGLKNRLEKLDQFETLVFMHKFDQKYLKLFAEESDITFREYQIFTRVLYKV